jgi:chitin synthase
MWIYMAFLMLQVSSLLRSQGQADTQFVLALGNRPKGERGLYLVTLWVYAVLALYLIVCSVILSIEAFKDVLGIDGSIGDKLMNMFKKTNGVLIAAVMSTIGELSRALRRQSS